MLAAREERRRTTSDEEIDIRQPQPGQYAVLVHGFETDQVAGGPGANYSLFTWSLGLNDAVGNLTVAAPSTVANGDRVDLEVQWSGLEPASRYLGAISHTTPNGLYARPSSTSSPWRRALSALCSPRSESSRRGGR